MAGPTHPTQTDSGLVCGDGGWSVPPAEGPRRGASFGRYVVLHEIGSGGMGVVYAAYDPELDRRVALKVLGEAAGTDTGRARLIREAQTMARLSHPNVITVHDVGEVGGRLFIAMELVAGCDLKRWLEQTRPWEDVLSVLIQAGRGLAAAHDQGLIHRDFKPANVLVGDDGLVRVLDFGLARRFGSVDEATAGDTGDHDLSSSHHSHTEQLTRTGAIAGTPAYMSPEQHARGELDGKSDQFSFCITAFEALFGERPFDGNGRMALMLQTTQGERRPVPRSTPVPTRISDAIIRGLEPKSSERWPDMQTLLQQLERPCAQASGDCLSLSQLEVVLPTYTSQGGVSITDATLSVTDAPPAPLSSGSFTLPAGSVGATATATIAGNESSGKAVTTQDISGRISPATDTVSISNIVFSYDNSFFVADLRIDVQGSYGSRAPVAAIQVVDAPSSCGAPVAFQARSVDYDGDKLDHRWFVTETGESKTGALFETLLQPGTHHVSLLSKDPLNRTGSATLAYQRSCRN